jgi:hypothetical protein
MINKVTKTLVLRTMTMNINKTLTVVTMIAAMTVTAFGASDLWLGSGAVDELWSNPANWTIDGPGPLPSIKTVIGDNNYGVPGANNCTLDIDAGTLPAFECYGGGVLNIVAGGILTLAEGGDRGIYVLGGDVGSRINLHPGGTLILENPQDGFNMPAEFYAPGGSVVADAATMPGYTIYTSDVPAAPAGVEYTLSCNGALAAGTLTFDSSVAPTSTDGSGNHTYTHPTAALPAFSLTRDGTTGVFDRDDDAIYEFYLITDAAFTPLFLFVDIDDLGGSNDFFYTEVIFDLTTGLGRIVGPGDLTGVTLTAAGGGGGTPGTLVYGK